MRVLNVDDNAQNLYLIESVVRAHGDEVVSAHNGVEALRELEKQPFDLVVSDVLMPEMDGFQLCHELKSRDHLRRIPFIFYTATYTAKQDEELGLALGASRFLVKPVEPERFMSIVAEVLREAQTGQLPASQAVVQKEDSFLKVYNERLIHKLEQKVSQLEASSQSLGALLEEREQELDQRRGAEEALRRSQEQLSLVWERSLDGMRLTDAEGVIRRGNRALAQLYGKPVEELEGQSLTCCYAPEARQPLLDTYREETRSRTLVARREALVTLWDGRQVWLDWSNALIETSEGPLVLSIFRDITAQRRALEEKSSLELQLLRAQKLESVGRLAGGVAHDFNNLLTVINGYGDLLLGSLQPGEPLRDFAVEIKKAGERATGLTRQLLAFSRKQVLEPRTLNLNDVVADTQKMLQRVIGEDVELEALLDPALSLITADPGQMNQVLMNLAVNARDAMPHGGKITIETSNVELDDSYDRRHSDVKPGPYVQITVSDTGHGMDEDTQSHMFEPFFTTKERDLGTGLGLSTVYGIVRQSGGWIGVRSEPGKGTAFRLCFPKSDLPAETPEGVASAKEGLRGNEAVLVVEDQEEVRKLIVAVLKGYGYRVLEASGGEEAMRHCERTPGPIHLLITDVVMPGMAGRELAERFRALRPATRVLYTSGYTTRLPGGSGRLDPDVAYLAKPFLPDGLAAKVRAVLGPPRATRKILVADDEAAVRGLLRQILQSAGYEVLEATDGRVAMEIMESTHVDLAIVDLVMPEQEGMETLRAMRQRWPGMKAIAMSGAFGGDFLKVARLLGAAATLQKPVQAEQLIHLVDQVLGA